MNLKSCEIIAEIGQNHDGSLGIAHSYIDAVSKTGADAIKFQTHIAHAETTSAESWRVKFSTQDKTRYDYWKRMEFSESQWHELKSHTDDLKLKFLSSAFSLEAVELLKRVGVYAWKIASGEVNNMEILDAIAETSLPVYLSTGMSTISEIDRNVELIKSRDLPVTVLQCTSMYPTPVERIGLNMIDIFRERYSTSVGLSDHSGSIYTGFAAAAKGIEVLEIHVTHSKEMFGPDVSSSITVNDLKILVNGVQFIDKLKSHEVDKDSIAKELQSMRDLFTKSIVYRMDLERGTTLERKHICFKKPGHGVEPSHISDVIGKVIKRPVKIDTLLSMEDLK